MIFIALFVLIAIVIIGLNLHDSSNLEKIEQHLKNSSCSEVIYSKGSYKALCEDKILQIENSFTIDLQKNSKTIYYHDITSAIVKKENIIVNEKEKLEFKLEDEALKFHEALEKKLEK